MLHELHPQYIGSGREGLVNRALSEDFLNDLRTGMLKSMVERVRTDDTLMLALRGKAINVYYRGGSLLKLTRVSSGTYSAYFDNEYLSSENAKPVHETLNISSESDCHRWIATIPALKEVMNRYFSLNPKGERESQQILAWENSRSSQANESEYFITDIEFAEERGTGRSDMLGVKWPAGDRKRGSQCRPVVIEMKNGTGAYKGTSE